MTTTGTAPARWWPGIRPALRSPFALWPAFILVHLWLGLAALYGDGYPLGDVTIVYRFWADQVIAADFWVGVHSPWVYPIVAIFPMLAAATFGPEFYASTWLTLVMVLNAAGFACIIGWGRKARHVAAGWWWLAFLVLLGPIAVGRIDAITIPLAIAGMLWAASRPRVAAVLLALAAWIKVWPAALVAALVVAASDRWRILLAAVSTSAAIVACALLFGSGQNVISFVTQQTGRGLQIEAPISGIWMWQAYAGVPGSYLYYDDRILTYQVTGDGAGLVSTLMTPLLALVVAAIVLLAVLALRRGASAMVLLPPLTLALVSALIAFNKVGSPQFISWLAVPVILGLATARERRFLVPAALVAVIAGLTQVVYPYLYGFLLGLHPVMLSVLTVRNLLLFVLLGWAIAQVWRAGRLES